MELSSLIDNEVCDHHGHVIGTIEELLLCSVSGCISHAVVVCPNKTRVRVPWGEMTVTKNGFTTQARDSFDPER
jgi:sporulation protein YlmC with PRC-barrel domain